MTPDIDHLSKQMRARIATIREQIQALTGEKYILEREASALMTGKKPGVVLAELEVREIVLPMRTVENAPRRVQTPTRGA